jgi:SAM-dependent methyltransferase
MAVRLCQAVTNYLGQFNTFIKRINVKNRDLKHPMTSVYARELNQNPKCFICGSLSEFICKEGFTLRESLCPTCGASRRNSDLAKILLNTFSPDSILPLRTARPKLTHLSIFESQSTGLIHDTFAGLPYYICSEYFDNVPRGKKNPNGIVCQDLQDLTFSSDYFDVVITQDILEHVGCPEKALSEIHRVLKPGGYHIFTIPYHEGKTTLIRITIEDGKKIQNYPPVYHGDPLREQGALVYTDFGSDMKTMIEKQGFSLENIPCGIWYSSSELPYITNEKEYQRYQKYSTEGIMLKFFKYNSWVFRSKKK